MALIKLNATRGLEGALPAVSGASLTGITAETNTPIFYGELSSSHDVNNGSTRIAQINNIVLDTASGWDSSNYKWTVPSGQGGKYFISGSIQSSNSDNNNVAWNLVKIYINGTEYEVAGLRTANNQSNYVHASSANVSVIRSLSAADYVQLYGITYGGGTTKFGNELTSLKIFKVSS